ncbi:3485_t:CDS:2, partial [Acaulospora colombiana]
EAAPRSNNHTEEQAGTNRVRPMPERELGASSTQQQTRLKPQRLPSSNMDDKKGIHKIVKRRRALRQDDAQQVAKLVSLSFPDKRRQRERKRRGHIRKMGRVKDREDQAGPNENYVNWLSRSSKTFPIHPPLSRKGEEPNQHSRLCLRNCNWHFVNDPLETNKMRPSINTELKKTLHWQGAHNSHLKVYSEPLKGQETRFMERGPMDPISRHHTGSRNLTPDMPPEDELPAEKLYSNYPDSDEVYTCQLVCILKNIFNSKSRIQWSFMEVMRPSNMDGWRLMNYRDLKRWDIRRASGNMTYNDESQDSDIWSSNSLAQFLSITFHSWVDDSLESYYVDQELSTRTKLASLFASIMQTDVTRAHWYDILNSPSRKSNLIPGSLERPLPPSVLIACNHPVFSDMVATPNEEVLPWNCDDPIVFFAAQYRSVTPSRWARVNFPKLSEPWKVDLCPPYLRGAAPSSYKTRVERQLSPKCVVIVTTKRKPRRKATSTPKNKQVPKRSDQCQKLPLSKIKGSAARQSRYMPGEWMRGASSIRLQTPERAQKTSSYSLYDNREVHEIAKKRLIWKQDDKWRVANLISSTLPDKPKQRKRKRRGYIRKLECGEDQAASNENYVNWLSRSSKTFPPLSRKGEEPSQHSHVFKTVTGFSQKTLYKPTDRSPRRPLNWGRLRIGEHPGIVMLSRLRAKKLALWSVVQWNLSLVIILGPGILPQACHQGRTYQEKISVQVIPNQMGDVMRPSNTTWWRFMNHRDIKRWDSRRASGNMVYNDESPDSDIWSSNSLAQFLFTVSYSWWGHSLQSHYVKQELSTRMRLASLFASIMKTDITRTHWYGILNSPFRNTNLISGSLERPLPPSVLTACNHPVFSDVVATPNEAVLPWGYDGPIVLFAAQYRSGDLDDGVTQLAHSLQSGINILILYYLETRHDTDQFLPNWMYLYGIVYFESGFRVYTHYPLYQAELSTGSGVGGWSARSSYVDYDLTHIFEPYTYEREMAIAALLRIQSHMRFVLNRLRGWDGVVQQFNAIE